MTFVIRLYYQRNWITSSNRGVPNQFAERLRQIRRHRGLSQKQLAQLCRLSQSAISNYENGTRRLSYEILTLAKALNVSPQWLAEGRGNKEPDHAQQAEPVPPYVTDWPFVTIKSKDLVNLSDDELALAEAVLKSLVHTLKKQRKE